MDTPIIKAVQVAVTAAIGVFMIGIAVEGFLFKKANVLIRIVSLIGAFLLIDSGAVTDLVGIAVCAAVIIYQKTMQKKSVTIAA